MRRSRLSAVPPLTGSLIEPLPEVHLLVMALDEIASQRPGRPGVPGLVFTGAGSAGRDFVGGYRERLASGDGSDEPVMLAPHALIEDGRVERHAARRGVEPDVALFDELAGQLENTVPPGAGSLRLRTFRVCRAVLDAKVGGGSRARRRKQLRNHLFAEYVADNGWLGWLEGLARTQAEGRSGPWWWAVVAPLVCDLPRWAYGRWLAGSPRLRWFCGQLAQAGAPATRDFLSAGCWLAKDGADRGNESLIRLVLLTALVRDLRQFSEPGLLSAYRRRREWPFVVLLASVDGDGPSRRFLDSYAALQPGEPDRPVLLLAGTSGEPPGYAPGFPEVALGTVAETLREESDGRSRGEPPGLRHVELPAAAPARDAADWIGAHRKVLARESRGRDWAPLVATVTAATVLLAAGTAYGVSRLSTVDTPSAPPNADPNCRLVHPSPKSPQELVGITDGSCKLSDELWPYEQQILAENRKIGTQPYRTVVFLAPLTVPPSPERTGGTSLPRLLGAMLAQRELNDEAGSNGDKVPIRLLVANTGDRFIDGESVAEQLVELARSDDTLAGVIGIWQSRVESKQAIRSLQPTRLPVIGVMTGDDMKQSSSKFFQLSPRNSRVTRVLLRLLEHQPIIRVGHGALVPAGKAVVLRDSNDYFSANLAEDFIKRYGAGNIIGPIDYGETPGDTAEDVAKSICKRLRGTRNFIFYASRSQQFEKLLAAHDDPGVPECKDVHWTVVGGSQMTTFVADHTGQESRPFLDLYYAAFSAPGDGLPPRAGEFRGKFSDFQEKFRNRFRADSDSAGAYDSLYTVSNAINKAFVSNGRKIKFDPGVVVGKLEDSVVYLDGATGYISFDLDHIAKDKLVIVMKFNRESSSVVFACGRPSYDAPSTQWQAAYECPTDDTDN